MTLNESLTIDEIMERATHGNGVQDENGTVRQDDITLAELVNKAWYPVEETNEEYLWRRCAAGAFEDADKYAIEEMLEQCQ